MKKILLLFVAFATSAFTLFAQPIYNEHGIRLQHSPIQEEVEWATSKGVVASSVLPAPPPVGQLRPVAEWEPAEAVLIRYPLGIPYFLIKEMSEYIKVITVVSSSYHQTAINNYTSNGVNMANCEFLIADTDSYWTRDYGPWFMTIDDNELAMFDFNYNRIKYGHGGSPRHLDNAINQALANYLSGTGTQIDRYPTEFYLTGGNYMNDGVKMALSTTLIPTENPEYTLPLLKQQFQEYLGIEEYHFIPDPIYSYDLIQHIDCWSKLLAPDKVLVARVPSGTPHYDKFEAAKDSMAALTSAYGTPMQVFRVDVAAVTSSTKTPYTNSLILNNKVFVPIGGNSYDAAALQVYSDAMPGYTIIPVTQASSTPWWNTDALHCRTHEIADRCMLYIKHQPLFGNITNTGAVTFNAEVYSYCDNTIYSDSVLIYLKHSGGAYQKYNMTYQGDNNWEVTISGLPSGLMEYYVFAADESGRRECHPYIGAPDPHKFTLTGDSPDLPALVIDKTSSSVTSDGFAVIEDHITVSNVGTADLTFEITNIDFPITFTVTPLTGTVQPDGSQVITLFYDFASVENGVYTGSFKLLSNDPLKPETVISLSAIQNVTTPIPVLSLDKTTSTVTLDGITTIEDYITASNIGNADLEFKIEDIEFPAKLTVTPSDGTIQPGSSQVITLTYEFDYAKSLEYTGSFKILSNDPLKPEVEISLSATIVTGINEWTIDNGELKIYPNPTDGQLIIENGELTIENVEIFDMMGKNVSRLTSHISHPISIDISHLPSGIYFLRIQTENGVVMKKVIKSEL
jgi:agmatine/peptidylarginine deiminase